MARLRTDIFVSALLRRVSVAGGMGMIVAKGFEEAGALHVEWRFAGRVGLLAPAPSALHLPSPDEDRDERRFVVGPETDDAAIASRMASERRFDPDCWHVEIEGVDPRTVLEIVADEADGADL